MNQDAIHFFDDRHQSGAYAYLCFDGDSSLPAIGGIRVSHYTSLEQAQNDARRLAQSMTQKAKTHDLPLSGAKLVCYPPNSMKDRSDFFKRLGEFINPFQGRYIAAMDSGITLTDMDTIHTVTPYVCNTSQTGSPAPYTAKGVYRSILSISEHTIQRDIDTLSIAIIGAGAVGSLLINFFEGLVATLQVSETNPTIQQALQIRQINCIPTETLITTPCDILLPCAIGGTVHAKNIHDLRCQLIIGAANNPLDESVSANDLGAHSIGYVPDTISNAGGLIFCAAEFLNQPDLLQHIDRIPQKAINYLNNDLNYF